MQTEWQSVDPDQTAPLGSALFAQAYLSEKLRIITVVPILANLRVPFCLNHLGAFLYGKTILFKSGETFLSF